MKNNGIATSCYAPLSAPASHPIPGLNQGCVEDGQSTMISRLEDLFYNIQKLIKVFIHLFFHVATYE